MAQDQPGEKATSGKPGSDPEAAKAIGGKGDFGVPVSRTRQRTYTSENTKKSDRGAAQSAAGQGQRVSGVGGNESGPGGASGGDIDTSIVGVGTGGTTVSQSGVTGRPPGPDDSDGGSGEFASGGPAEGKNQARPGQIGGSDKVTGSTLDHSGDDAQTNPPGAGAAAANPKPVHDDSFVGEVSTDEAAGQGG